MLICVAYNHIFLCSIFKCKSEVSFVNFYPKCKLQFSCVYFELKMSCEALLCLFFKLSAILNVLLTVFPPIFYFLLPENKWN